MTKVNDVVDLETRGAVAVVRVNNPPVNALSRGVRDGLFDAVSRANQDASVKVIVLACAGKTFIAGADIREFGLPPEGRSLPEVMDAIENASKPVVAALHGTALGGGLEVALTSHYRVAVPSTRLGLPEVKLGILPGAGGTQRLPRLIGLTRALEMMTSGDPIGAQEALKLGLVDQLLDGQGDLETQAVAWAEKLVAEQRPLRRIRDLKDKLAEGTPEFFAKFRKSQGKKNRGFPAPEKIIQCVEAAVQKPFDEGLKFERESFAALRASSESKAQRYYFFAEREAAKVADLGADVKERPIKKVGIIGAGTMGGGIAMNFLNVGIPVVLIETKQEFLDRGLKVIRGNYERTASKGKMTQEDVEKRMGAISPSLELEKVADCDLVIEAVFENMDIKKQLFGKLDKIVKPGAILATNTSYLDVNEIASATKRPQDVIGLHFFSPANVMKLLEIVRGKDSAPDVVATSMALGKTIKKIPVLVGVCHGFVGNRMLAARRDQAMSLIEEGAMPWDVDRVLEEFGMPMGSFAMGDLAGLDIGWSAETSKPDTVLRDKLVELGRRGQKTGAGYYKYDPQTRERSIDPVVGELVTEFAKKSGKPQRKISDQEILERCLYSMVNEGAKILEEGIAQRASDIDVVWINGYGWPVYRGGPMFWADSIGLAKVYESVQAFEKQFGSKWKPSNLLKQLAEQGKTFTRQ
ncbi:MAG TPA: 3-hydroxyacyl-CoA dehydrogenase NAD-binding domain-containing protein [Polyangiales bacterium]|nr:3-hydroxyacyl-CoA dehydrogenase NAD-binding domain-containing protein [Polyangiales bacterium]